LAREADDLVRRAREKRLRPDDVTEGTFTICSFWLVSALSEIGEAERARQLCERVLAFERTMIGSDGLPHDAAPHPRLWGTFPRVLGHYARGLGLFPLETAVHKMTGMAAARLRLADRGLLRPGYAADLALFDAATVKDEATFADPHRHPTGVPYVVVNGDVVVDGGRFHAAGTGRVLHSEGG